MTNQSTNRFTPTPKAKLMAALMLGSSLLLASCGDDSSSTPEIVPDVAAGDDTPTTPPTNVTAAPSFASEVLNTDVLFASTGTEDLFLDVYGPEGDDSTDRPLIILASGGSFVFEDRDIVADTAQAFAERGFVAVTMDYRVLSIGADGMPFPTATPAELATLQATSEAALAAAIEAGTLTGPEIFETTIAFAVGNAVQDMFAAVRFMRASAQGDNPYGINEDLIFVGGESAGAVIAMAVTTFNGTDTPIMGNDSSNVLNQNAFFAANGIAGMVGDNNDVSAAVAGAFSVAGAVNNLGTLTDNDMDVVVYAAHNELDMVVPCDSTAEGATGLGLITSGSCDFIPALNDLGAATGFFFVEGDTGHVDFEDEGERDQIYTEATQLFLDAVIAPPAE